MSHGKEQNTAQGYFCAIWDNGLGRAEMQKNNQKCHPRLTSVSFADTHYVKQDQMFSKTQKHRGAEYSPAALWTECYRLEGVI